MSTPPDYGIIYNWDGAPHGYSPVPQSMDAFLDKTYAPLEDTQVGALFWCVGEHATRWPSDALELVGDLHQRRYENAASYTHTENIRRMLDRGEDPQQAVIDRGHQLGLHVYASLRMNDNHFNGAQPSDLQTLHHVELTKLRKDHPEWLLGEDTEEWFALSWNMAIPSSARKSLPALARSLPKLPLGRRRTRLATPSLPLPRRLCLSPALHFHRFHAGGAATDRRTSPRARPAFLFSSPRRRVHRGLSPHWLRRGGLG